MSARLIKEMDGLEQCLALYIFERFGTEVSLSLLISHTQCFRDGFFRLIAELGGIHMGENIRFGHGLLLQYIEYGNEHTARTYL